MNQSYYLVLFYIVTNIMTSKCTDDFKDLSYFERATKSPYFVDKTSFLNAFFNRSDFLHKNHALPRERQTVIIFVRPKGFGKSTILDMARRFFEIPFNKTTGQVISTKNTTHYYKLFNNKSLNLEIARDKNFSDEHFGQYPVIYLDFSNIQGTTTEQITISTKKKIIRIFKSYRWLLQKTIKCIKNSTDKQLEKNLNYFKRGFKKIPYENDIVQALDGLGKLLARHFNRKPVMVLIDDFDTPVTRAMNNNVEYKVLYEFLSDIARTFSEYFFARVPSHVIITGVSSTFFQGWEHLPLGAMYVVVSIESMFDSHQIFHPYFGFTDEEVDRLLIIKNSSQDERKKIKNYFNGYNFLETSLGLYEDRVIYNTTLYHPAGIISYFERNTTNDDYFPGDISKFIKCLRHWSFFNTIFKLLVKIPISSKYYIIYFKPHFQSLVELIEANCSNPYPHDTILENALWDNGYLSSIRTGKLKLPNAIAAFHLRREFYNFFQDTYSINLKKSLITTTMESIMSTNITTDEMLTNLVAPLQQIMIKAKQCDRINRMEFLSIISAAIFYNFNFDGNVDLKLGDEYLYARSHPEIDLLTITNRNKKILLIVKLTYNETLEKAINISKTYTIPRYTNFKLIKYLGINMNERNQLEIGKGKNWEEMDEYRRLYGLF